jgi:acetylornithine deacetylase
MLRIAGRKASRTVSYGTDGVMFGAMKQMLVLGPGDIAQAHTWDEFIELDQLQRGTELYRRVIQELCE